MSDGLVITFQSQLSIIMETILKSAMTEITRLVEESFMDEVTRGKQELELLLRRLQFSESKLKESERRVRCSDCGRATSTCERTDEKPTEMLAGEESLCFRLSLREQSEKKPPFSDVWSSTEALDAYVPTGTQAIKDKNVMDTGEMCRKQESTSKNTVPPPPPPQCVLQNLLSSAAVTTIHESCSRLKSSESQCKTLVRDLTPSKELDVAQSRLMQSFTGEVQVSEVASFPANGSVKSELGPDPDLVAVKEEDEMIPVWDCRDDDADGVTDQNPAGSWNESQVDNFPNLTALKMPDPSSHLTFCSVNCNTEITPSIKAERVKPANTDLVRLALTPMPDKASSYNYKENGHLFELCPGEHLFHPVPLRGNGSPQSDPPPVHEKAFTQIKAHAPHLHEPLSCSQCYKTFTHSTELKEHQRQHHLKDRPHVCLTCGKAFTRFSNFKQHQNIHTHEKLFNCTHCGMRFKRSTHLRMHLRRHSRVGKNCPCHQCGKTFVCLKQLKGHLLKVHGTEIN